MPSGYISGILAEVFHLNVKYHVTLYKLLSNGRIMSIREYIKSNSRIINLTGYAISIISITIFLSISSASATVVGTSILNLWFFFRYLGFLFLTKEIIQSRFFNKRGGYQLNAWRWAYSTVSKGWDYFISLNFSQDVEPSFHWQNTCHPTVEQRRDALTFTKIFWSSIESEGLVLRKSILPFTNAYWFPSGSHCAYMDSEIAFAVNYVTSTSLNCTVYSCESKIGLIDARP